MTVEAQLADLRERLRRVETSLAALPRSLFQTRPIFPSDFGGLGSLLVGAPPGFGVLEPGTDDQQLVVDSAEPLGLRWEDQPVPVVVGVGTGMALVVLNQSTVVSDADVATMTEAVNVQCAAHVAPAWDILAPSATFAPDAGDPGSWPAHDAVVRVLDDTDVAGALGYHTQFEDGSFAAYVFAATILDGGAGVLTGPLSVACVLSHEVLEVVIDPAVQMWASNVDTGGDYAFEICDPVESTVYPITVTGGTVEVSNFVLPDWFNGWGDGPYDYLGDLVDPFSLSPGGYLVYKDGTGTHVVFGAAYPEWRKTMKRTEYARTGRRLGKRTPEDPVPAQLL